MFVNNYYKYIYWFIYIMNEFFFFLRFTFLVKIVLVLLIVYSECLKIMEPHEKQKLLNAKFWESRVEFVFKTLMSLVLIYLFNSFLPNPNRWKYLLSDVETRFMLTVFGYVLLMTADWRKFFYGIH
jgi:hypothetical protein